MLIGKILSNEAFHPQTVEMPAYDDIKRILVLRTTGEPDDGEYIGGGFLHKKRYIDNQDFKFPRFVMVLVLRGSGRYVDSSGHEYKLSPGSVFVRRPNEMHSNYVDTESGYVECYLEIGPRLYEALRVMNILPTVSPVQQIQPDNEIPRRIWRMCRDLSQEPDSELPRIIGEMISIFGVIKRQILSTGTRLKYQDIIDWACQELSRNFQSKFSVQRFCRKHSIGYENFRKLFKSRTGFSPCEYRLNRRLESAALLLRDKRLRINEIADQLGYSSQYEFSAQFKRKYGVSPRKYQA